MINQVILVGRLVNEPKLRDKQTKITLAVPRIFKNSEGVYEVDFIECELFGEVAEKTFDCAKKNDVVGIKGRVQTAFENKRSYLEIVAEKITFLSSEKVEEK